MNYICVCSLQLILILEFAPPIDVKMSDDLINFYLHFQDYIEMLMRNCIQARKCAFIRRNKRLSPNIEYYFVFCVSNYLKHVAKYKTLFVYFISYLDYRITIISILRIHDLMAIKNIKDYNRIVVLLQLE